MISRTDHKPRPTVFVHDVADTWFTLLLRTSTGQHVQSGLFFSDMRDAERAARDVADDLGYSFGGFTRAAGGVQ